MQGTEQGCGSCFTLCLCPHHRGNSRLPCGTPAQFTHNVADVGFEPTESASGFYLEHLTSLPIRQFLVTRAGLEPACSITTGLRQVSYGTPSSDNCSCIKLHPEARLPIPPPCRVFHSRSLSCCSLYPMAQQIHRSNLLIFTRS